ncbi:MAG: methyltransferase [Candidatus Brocadia sp.]|nr:methyltransferase [Candidatus Brocadia sp.]
MFSQKDKIPLQLHMMHLAAGHFRAQAIYVAAKLGIADLLKDGPKTINELSNATKAHAYSLYRLLRALASIDIFQEEEEGRFGLTPLATTLQSDSTTSVLPGVLLAGSEFHWEAWSNLFHSVMTGESAFEHINGIRFFDYLAKNPDAGVTFDAWMTRSSEMQIPAIVNSYDFSGYQTIVDIGGGHGSLLAAILKANPHLKGILFDMPEVLRSAKKIRNTGIEARCEMVSGDMFRSIPPGGDLYILKTVIHDWSDELSIKILRNCHAAMTDQTRLLVIESIVPTGNQPHFSKFMDLNMLVLNHGGRERTEAEYRSLFHSAGFRLTNSIKTPSPLNLIEGIRIAEGFSSS